tara:strand:+ start:1030 stop:1398 length:369 start_codon:yes stop_codon:yes gene_type:complete
MRISNRSFIVTFFSSLLFILALPSWAESREQIAWKLIEQGALVIDVRTTEEYATSHLANALHIPYQAIEKQFTLLEIRKDRPVVLYCRSGNRAGIAYKTLEDSGYTALHNGGGLEGLINTPH